MPSVGQLDGRRR